jgi:hypothetical protein
LEKAAEHGAQRGVKIKKMWDSADGYDELGWAEPSIHQETAADCEA